MLKGKVAVFKFRDDTDVNIEKDFYNKSKRFIGSLIGNRNIVPLAEILEDFDKKSLEVFSKLSDSVLGSKINLIKLPKIKSLSILQLS